MCKNDDIRIVSSHSWWVKLVFVTCIAACGVAGTALLRGPMIAQDFFWSMFMVLTYVWLIVGGLISMVRFRIVASEFRLTRRFIGMRTLQYRSVSHLHFHWSGKIVVKGEGVSIELVKGVTDKEKLFRFVVDKVKDNPNLKVTGEEDRIIGYLGPDWKK